MSDHGHSAEGHGDHGQAAHGGHGGSEKKDILFGAFTMAKEIFTPTKFLEFAFSISNSLAVPFFTAPFKRGGGGGNHGGGHGGDGHH